MWKWWVLFGWLCPLSAWAGELTGYAALESRVFLQGPQFAGPEFGNTPSLVLEPEWFHITEDQRHTVTVKPFARYDHDDHHRSHWDVRQLDWLYAADEWSVRIGASKVFWGVTESNHLVDIINQTDVIESIDGEDKLGQPMVEWGWFQPWGNLRFYYLPYFRERTLAGYTSRLRGEIPIENRAIYASEDKQWHPDVAVRYSQILGDWDVALSHFSGTSREPILVSDRNGDGASIFRPYYDLIDQTSLELQYTIDAWLWKFEGMSRQGSVDRFSAFTGGVEYTFFTLAGGAKDLGLLLEYSRDDRDVGEPATLLDDDVFLATRLTFNDVSGTEILSGVLIDRRSFVQAYSVEATRRLNNHWKVELEGRFFNHIGDPNPEVGLKEDNMIQLKVNYYF